MNYQNMTDQTIKNYYTIKKENPNVSLPKDGVELMMDLWHVITTTPKPIYDIYTQTLEEIAPIDYVQTWQINEMTQPELDAEIDKLKLKLISDLSKDVEANNRPSVSVPLEDTSTINIWGGRDDQFDIGDRYNLMLEDSVPNLYLKDADDAMQYLGHLDVKRCYKAITIHRNDAIEYQWAKEVEINACTTIAELQAITWEVT